MQFNRSWLDMEAEIHEVFVDESKFKDAGLGLFAAKGAYGYILLGPFVIVVYLIGDFGQNCSLIFRS